LPRGAGPPPLGSRGELGTSPRRSCRLVELVRTLRGFFPAPGADLPTVTERNALRPAIMAAACCVRVLCVKRGGGLHRGLLGVPPAPAPAGASGACSTWTAQKYGHDTGTALSRVKDATTVSAVSLGCEQPHTRARDLCTQLVRHEWTIRAHQRADPRPRGCPDNPGGRRGPRVHCWQRPSRSRPCCALIRN
jgi:hypothetical protein